MPWTPDFRVFMPTLWRVARLGDTHQTMNDSAPVSNSLIDWSGTTGLVAIVVLSLDILMGLLLSSRYNFVRNWPHRRIPLFKMHNWTGYVALAVVLLHPTLLLFQSAVKFRVIDVLWPINSPQQPLINTAGAIAAYALVFIVVTSYFRARISPFQRLLSAGGRL